MSEAFQTTEIGKFPSAWENHQLADVCERVKDSYKPVAGGNTPYVGLEHLAQGFPAFVGRGTESDVKSSKTAFKAGDILFGKLRSYLRKGAQADFDGISSTDILVFRAEGLCEAGFLKYLIHSDEFIDHAKSTTSGVQHPRTSWSSLKEFRFSLPPLPEQKKIAHILSTVQRAIEAQEQIIQTTTELFKTMLHQLMTAQISVSKENQITKNSKENLDMNIEEFQFPLDWKLGSVAEAFDFTSKPRGLDLSKNGEEIPFFPMDKIPLSRIHVSEFIPKPLANLGSGTYVENGDLMVAKITPSFENGKQAIVNIETDFAYATTEVIPMRGRKGESDTLFLFFYLLHPEVRSDLAGKMEGSTGRQRLSKAVLGNRLIPLPPLPEQKKIAKILSTIQQKVDNAEIKKAKHQDIFRTLLHELMTAKIRAS